MSKKTDSIYKSIEELEGLQKALEELKSSDLPEEKLKELDNISFGLAQELKTLRFWIDSLYKYNGKSTSQLKKTASAKNGLKGGRPPKEITQLRRRIVEIETEMLPALEHQIVMADSNEELANLKNQREMAFTEIVEARSRIREWKAMAENAKKS